MEASQTYETDLTDRQWANIEPLIPNAKSGGRPRTTDMRQVINAMLYQLRTGCQWRMLPKGRPEDGGFPPYTTVHDYFRAWRDSRLWERINERLREQVRKKVGRRSRRSAFWTRRA